MRIWRNGLFLSFLGSVCLAFSSCTKHEIETKSQIEVAPIEVKPIHITIDVNLRVERALDDVFKDIDQQAQSTTPDVKGGASDKD